MTLEQQYKQTAKELSKITSLDRMIGKMLDSKTTKVYEIVGTLRDYGFKPRTRRDCMMISAELRLQKLKLERKWKQIYYEINK